MISIHRIRKVAFVVVSALLQVGCNEKTMYILSPDRSQCITVITENNIRFVMEGRHDQVPGDNYIKLDISKTTELSDAIYICWKSHNKSGEIVVPKTTTIENRMKPNLYTFRNELPKDNVGIPRPTNFTQVGCTSIGFSYKDPYPKGSAIIE